MLQYRPINKRSMNAPGVIWNLNSILYSILSILYGIFLKKFVILENFPSRSGTLIYYFGFSISIGMPHQPCSSDILPVSTVGFLYPDQLYLKWSKFFQDGPRLEKPSLDAAHPPNKIPTAIKTKINLFILNSPLINLNFFQLVLKTLLNYLSYKVTVCCSLEVYHNWFHCLHFIFKLREINIIFDPRNYLSFR